MEINLIIKDQKILIQSIHMAKAIFKFTNKRDNTLTKTRKMLKTHKKKTIIKHLKMLNFQNKVIYFTLTNIFQFDENMIEAKKEDLKIKISLNGTIKNKFQCGGC